MYFREKGGAFHSRGCNSMMHHRHLAAVYNCIYVTSLQVKNTLNHKMYTQKSVNYLFHNFTFKL